MAGKYTDADMSLLTEEERAGLIEEQGEAEPPKPEAAAEEPIPEAAASETAEAAPVAEAEEAKPAEAVPAAEDPDKATPEPTQHVRQAVPNWAAPSDLGAKLAAFDAREAEIEAKFESGEMPQREYREKIRAVDRERRTIEDAKLKADIALETRAAVWSQQTVASFLEANPIYGQNDTLFAALDVEVRKLQGAASDPFSPSLLNKAHAKVQAAFAALGGKQVQEEKPAPVAAKPAPKAPEKQIEVKPRDPIPPTLAKVPAADPEALNGGKFAVLDRLSSSNYEEFEKALAKMSEADRNAYLSGA